MRPSTVAPHHRAQAVGIAQAGLTRRWLCERRRASISPSPSSRPPVHASRTWRWRSTPSRLVVHHAAGLSTTGSPAPRSSLVRSAASDTAMKGDHRRGADLRRLRLHREFPVERFMRDAKITQIYERHNQIQRVVIAQQLLGSPDRHPITEESMSDREALPVHRRTFLKVGLKAAGTAAGPPPLGFPVLRAQVPTFKGRDRSPGDGPLASPARPAGSGADGGRRIERAGGIKSLNGNEDRPHRGRHPDEAGRRNGPRRSVITRPPRC